MSASVALVSLGCAKNQVNSEQMLHLLRQAGYRIQEETEGAALVIVNTCGFITSAKQEAIDHILTLAEEGCPKILVTGCLAERYKEEILKELPEVCGLVGCGSFDNIVSAAAQALAGQTPALFEPLTAPLREKPRTLLSPAYTAYLKVAEGCDNHCSYCVIPSLRGSFRSMPVEEVLREAEALVRQGAVELIVVAQDTTRYGLDLYGEQRLCELLRALCRIEGLKWVRLHYLYPSSVTDELIEVIASEDKIVKYLDIPIQHISSRLLKLMNRRYTREDVERLHAALRERVPGIVLRTSLITGLPTETEEEFEELAAFMRAFRWERAGVFAYSCEEGTSAAALAGQVEPEEAQRRAEVLMDYQQTVMEDFGHALEGQTVTVLTEGYDKGIGRYYGRSYADSPEVDGKVFFTSSARLAPGDMVPVLITEAMGCDLLGTNALKQG